MKNQILIIALSFFAFIPYTSLKAQTTEINTIETSIKKDGKYALLVRNVQHLKAAIITGKELKTKYPDIQFEIVACGELVKSIAETTDLQNLIHESLEKEVKVLVCGLSIRQLNIDATAIPKTIPLTENGLIYIFGLQENGFKTITL